MGSARTRAWRRAQGDRLIAERTSRFIRHHCSYDTKPIGPGQLAKTKGSPKRSKVAYQEF